MKTSILILGLSLVLSNVSAKNFGGINIEGAGMVYVVGPDWSAEFVSVNGNGVTLSRGGRIYFAKDPVDDFSNPYMYWQTPLLGKRFSFDVGNIINMKNVIITTVFLSAKLFDIRTTVIFLIYRLE